MSSRRPTSRCSETCTRRYFPQTAISAPVEVSGLVPQETVRSVKYVARARCAPQNATMTISSSRHDAVQAAAFVHEVRTRRNCDEAPGGPGGPCRPVGRRRRPDLVHRYRLWVPDRLWVLAV